MNLKWIKCTGEAWCKLSTVNLAHSHFNQMYGVYIIWHGGPKPATAYIGRGIIRNRLSFHRNDPKVQEFSSLVLYVTWAAVPEENAASVENYLANRLNPKVQVERSIATPTTVNLPW